MSKKVAVIMGSDSDLDTMRPCIQRLKSFGIPTEVHIISAHRTPAAAERFASQARENGFGAIIAAAGKAAHLAGVLAGHTPLPVIGIPMKSSTMDGLDSLLSTVQMPPGVPVATAAIDGAENAGLLPAQMLTISDESLVAKLQEKTEQMRQTVIGKDKQLQEKLQG